MGEWAVEWDSKRWEVFGNVEDMSDDEGKTACSGILLHPRCKGLIPPLRVRVLATLLRYLPYLSTLVVFPSFTLPLSIWKNPSMCVADYCRDKYLTLKAAHQPKPAEEGPLANMFCLVVLKGDNSSTSSMFHHRLSDVRTKY